MNKIKSFEELKIWKAGINLANTLYTITSNFPKSEIFGLTQQIRRAGVSIPSNIAEGFGRYSKNEFHRFLRIALGSLSELKTQLLISKSQKFIDESTFKNLEIKMNEIGKMINGILTKRNDC
jgi:four helix bundle protein